MFQIVESAPLNAVIKVIGVGGGGGNAVQHMVTQDIEGVDFISVNTDAQALMKLTAPTQLQLGAGVTRGLGAGANPAVGKEAALEDKDRLTEVIKGADMVFITAGMGGGTGTGAAPVVARLAKEMNILTVAVVTKPFEFEGKKRMRVADEGIAELKNKVDSLITIPNEKLLTIFGETAALQDAFACVDDVLSGAVHGIADIITKPGIINVDFADVRTVMSEMGMAMMGTGQASGDDRARQATEAAISNPLLEDIDFTGARGVLVNISTGTDLSMGEYSLVNKTVKDMAADSATVVCGTVLDESLDEDLRVTVVAAGLGRSQVDKQVVNEPRIPMPVSGQDSYRPLDVPTIFRNGDMKQPPADDADQADMDKLNIPAFIRRQAN